MPAKNPFHSPQRGINDPFPGIIAITPDDDLDLAEIIRGLMVGGAGDVAVTMLDGSTGTLPGLQPGVQYTGLFRRILATGTDATGIIGLK